MKGLSLVNPPSLLAQQGRLQAPPKSVSCSVTIHLGFLESHPT